jgi:diguanylate cyclase (GGDEF)-like protein
VANTGLVVLMIGLRLGRSWSTVPREIAWMAPMNVLLGMTGASVGAVHAELGPFGIAMLAMPVLLMRWTLGFYASRGRATMRMLEHRAHYDALTDLPNRYLLEEQLQTALAAATDRSVAVILLGLDRFQEINNTFGHEAGDLVLRQVGPRLRTVVRQSDTLARLTGDEFVVVLPSADEADTIRVAEALRRALAEPFLVDGYQIEVGTSLGIALGPGHGADATTLIQHADVALAEAKRRREAFALYSPEQDDHTPERLALIGELRQAIEQDDLTLYYQPQVSVATGRVEAVEALVRWNHPRLGLLSPDQFVPLAEHSGLIKPLTKCVLRLALRQCRTWRDAGRDLSVSVNVSANDLHDSCFPTLVADLLSETGVPAGRLCLELTEGTMMTDLELTLDVLTRVSGLGVGLSVDDFGTGYASLAYLKRLPIHELKVDQTFIRELSIDAADAAIVESTIALGHRLGLTVVAEGVEDFATRVMLARFGCDVLQGFLISRPAPADDLDAWLEGYEGQQLRPAA